MSIERVKPGDIITAELINQMIDGINQLSTAVAALEQQQGVSPRHKRRKASRTADKRKSAVNNRVQRRR